MPKSIVREFDNSKPISTLSSNFAVFVPGYLGTPDGDAQELKKEAQNRGFYYATDDIYKLSSQAQFIRYIGKFGGGAEVKAVAPVCEILISIPSDTPSEGTEEESSSEEETVVPGAFQYHRALNYSEFENYDADKSDYCFYKGIEVTDPSDLGYNQDGYLLKTFTNSDGTTTTYRFKKQAMVDLWNDLDEQEGVKLPVTAGTNYFKISKGNEGRNAAQAIDQIGNQIAYELLGLGYTVYFKPLKTTSTAVEQLSNSIFWEPLRNKSTYRFRYLLSGGCYDASVAAQMKALANFDNSVRIEDADTYGNETGRGDIIALLDVDENEVAAAAPVTQADLIEAFGNAAKKLNAGSKYCAVFAPKVVYVPTKDPIYNPSGEYVAFPCSFHYLACAAYARERFAEWYAVAGYTRGICSKSIAYTTYNFGDIAINTLAPRVKNIYADYAINLVLNERGNYYLWGNRTAEPLNADGLIFSHFLNIRQLRCTLKQVLYEATRSFTFDPNSDLLWINFVNAIRPTLENMKADQGISGYRISKVATNKKALLVAKIRIVPIEAVEDFDISVYLEDSLTGIMVSADEEVAE